MRIWTMGYYPFTLGGGTEHPVACEIDVSSLKKHPIGKGYHAYLLLSPGGKNVVVESIGGGIVGNNLATVREDVRTAKKSVMAEQMEMSRIASKHPRELIEEKEFWRRWDGSDWEFEDE